MAGGDDRRIRRASSRECTPGAHLVLAVDLPATAETIAALCHRVVTASEECADAVLVCDLGAVTDPDMTVIDALARMQLIARRLGRVVAVQHACPAVRDLLAMAGLNDVLPLLRGDAESTTS